MDEKKLKVLAVDDDMINLKLLKTMLMKTPNVSAVVEAKNGADAIGGIEMLKVIRADESLRQLPVIVLTTDETKKGEALECGANGFLMKPVREKDVLAKIAQLAL